MLYGFTLCSFFQLFVSHNFSYSYLFLSNFFFHILTNFIFFLSVNPVNPV